MIDNHNGFFPSISICIPTFNRSVKVYELVTDLLLYPGHDMQVIVLDNCSTDNTKDILNSINDYRFFFIQNDTNIGGTLNPIKCLTLASGKFAFLCLDKDCLNHEAIGQLIGHVNTDPNVLFGRCAINIDTREADIFYEKGYSSLAKMAYSSRHPTGFFYRTNEFLRLKILEKIFTEKKKFPFFADLINAEMAILGKSQVINLPAFFTESKSEASITPSFTYDASSVYFSPECRIIEFDTYLQSAETLKLSNFDLFKLIWKIFAQELMLSTFVYKDMMSDKDVCEHHRITMQNITIKDIWISNLAFSSYFLHRKGTLNILYRISIVLLGQLKFIAKGILIQSKAVKKINY